MTSDQSKIENYIICGILLIIFIFSVLPWLKQGVPGTDDFRHHGGRLWFIKEEIQQGKFSEWMPYIYGGWPFFHFYHPLFYVLSLPVILFSNPIVALKIMTVIAYAIALVGTFAGAYLLLKDKKIALFASVAYFLSSQFLFNATVSGALPRLTAIALVPLVSSLLIKAIEEKTKKYIIASGIALAVIFMIHISVAVPVFIIGGFYALYEAYENKNIDAIKKCLIMVIIALGISAAWIIPLFAEKSYANFSGSSELGTPLFGQTLRTFGIVREEGHYIRSNYFGYSVLLLALAGLYFIKKNKTANHLKVGLIISTLFYFNIFGLLNFVPFISTALTGSTTFFIGMLVFNAVMLAALFARGLEKQFKSDYILYGILLLVILELYPAVNAFSYGWVDQKTENFTNPPELINAWNFIKQQEGNFVVFSAIGQEGYMYHGKQEFGYDWYGCPQCVQKDVYDTHTAIWENFKKGLKNDTLMGYFGVKYYVLPCENKFPNKLAYSNGAVCVYENEQFRPLVDSSAKITNTIYGLDSISFSAQSDKQSDVLIKTNYFKPHWHAYVNGKEVEIKSAPPAFMVVQVPQGESSVRAEYRTNSTSIVSWFITFLTIALMVYYGRK